MKHRLSLTVIVMAVVALMALTAAPARASHGAKLPTAPMPAHGSIWFGNGLGRYQVETARLAPPAHGSIWFGAGLDRYGRAAATPAMPAHGSVWFGAGLSVAPHNN